MSDERKAKQDAFYADEPWAKLATEAGFRPWDTESSARDAFRHCAESMVHRDLADALAAALREAITWDGQDNEGVDAVWLHDATTTLAAWEARK